MQISLNLLRCFRKIPPSQRTLRRRLLDALHHPIHGCLSNIHVLDGSRLFVANHVRSSLHSRRNNQPITDAGDAREFT